MILAPLKKGRRSSLAGESERQSSQIHGATAMQSTRERAKML
jgi:hypothetical protein